MTVSWPRRIPAAKKCSSGWSSASTGVSQASSSWAPGPLGDHLGEAGHVVGRVVQAWALGPQAGESLLIVGSRASGWRISQPVTSRILGGDTVPGSGAVPAAGAPRSQCVENSG